MTLHVIHGQRSGSQLKDYNAFLHITVINKSNKKLLTRKSFLRIIIVAFTCSNDEPTLRKFMLLLHFTRSLKPDNIDILYLWMLEKHNCLILT